MRSYLHRIPPMGNDNDENHGPETPRMSLPPSCPDSPAMVPFVRKSTDASSVSESSSEESNSDDGGDYEQDVNQPMSTTGHCQSQKDIRWLYSPLGKMRLLPNEGNMTRPLQYLHANGVADGGTHVL